MLGKMRTRRGFTLTEVVVVGIIIGILAAVSIPIYLGFLADSQLDLAKSTSEMIGAAATFAHNRGLEASSGDWGVLGISDPEDEFWRYTFDQVPPITTDLSDADFKVQATPKAKCRIADTYYFRPEPPAGKEKWSTDAGN